MRDIKEDTYDLHSTIMHLGEMTVEDPMFGDFKLNVFPIVLCRDKVCLPSPFDLWSRNVDYMLSHIPACEGANNHYVTIDSKFFPTDGSLRREGVHIDGNLCVDDSFPFATWAGLESTPDGGYKKEWESEHHVGIYPGKYVSSSLGGIVCASSLYGCRAWAGENKACIGSGGEITNLDASQNATHFKKDNIYFMSSNTPHETIPIKKGMRRTLIRITLNHKYDNKLIKCR